MSYQGPERRKNRVFVTRNREYYVRGTVCIAVRDKGSSQWLLDHGAVGSEIDGGIEPLANGALRISHDVGIGQRICFKNDLLTSAVSRVLRTTREMFDTLPEPTFA